MFKKHINKLITIKYKEREYQIRWFVCCENKKRVVLKYNPTDFIIDWYIYLRKKLIKKTIRDKNIRFIEKVILKTQNIWLWNININKNIRKKFNKKKETILIEKSNDNICRVWKIINNKKIQLNELSSKGIWWQTISQQKKSKIKVIYTHSHYIKTLEKISKKNI